jgi:chromosome partitioning protein
MATRKPSHGPPSAVSFANGKGGVAKTTLIANLSVKAANLSSKNESNVALLDYDPQQSLARWWALRGDSLFNPRLIKTDEPASVAVPRLKSVGAEWIMQDLPPAVWHLIEDSVGVSDLVIVPVKASPIDLESVDPIIEICQDLHKPFVFVLTMYDDKWKLSQSAFPYLERKAPGHTLEEVFSYRVAYVGSMIGGATGPEYNGDKKQAKAAADEIDLLWTAVKKRALAAVGT